MVLGQNNGFESKPWFLIKTMVLGQNHDFGSKPWFLIKTIVLCQNHGFWSKPWFWVKTMVSYENKNSTTATAPTSLNLKDCLKGNIVDAGIFSKGTASTLRFLSIFMDDTASTRTAWHSVTANVYTNDQETLYRRCKSDFFYRGCVGAVATLGL